MVWRVREMKILFISLGCDKNLVDSEVMLGLLTKHGYTLTDDETQADDIVINKESAVNDDRIGWEDSMYVCVKRMGSEDYIKEYGVPQCIGICATKYKK